MIYKINLQQGIGENAQIVSIQFCSLKLLEIKPVGCHNHIKEQQQI